jgi:predicted Rossmann fold nucleotide-binding protein DprA/Smf involved in DNA uptake
MSSDSTHRPIPDSARVVRILRAGDEGYPPAACQWNRWTDPDAFFADGDSVHGPDLAAVGATTLLSRPSIGLLCSVRCPGNLILATYDFAKTTPPTGPTIIGGFHSPMERTCFDTLLVRHVPVVYIPGRRLNVKGIPGGWLMAGAEERLLVLSPFASAQRHVTRDLARKRNLLIAVLCDTLFVPHAIRGGDTEGVARRCLQQGKDVVTFSDPENAHLIRLGARGVTLEEWLAMSSLKTQRPFP